MSKRKKIIATIIISIIILIVLSVLCYIIYVYGYYDNLNKNQIIENFNSFKFNKVYDDIYYNDGKYLTQKTFTNMTDIMFNKKNLEKIYDNYYKNVNKYKSKEEFIKKYYYGYRELTEDDVDFYYQGKTSLFTRMKTKSLSYNVTNGNNEILKMGIIKNITFNTNDDTALIIDNNHIDCNQTCSIDKIYSGIHTIEYIKNGYKFFTLYSITNNNASISLNNINTLIAISEEVDMNIFDDMDIKNIDLNVGIFTLSKCVNDNFDCPRTIDSYIVLNTDKTFSFYKFNFSINESPNIFSGTYRIENSFLILNYQSYKYTEVIDNKETEQTKLISKTETYNIYNRNKFYNDQMEFNIKD